MYDKTEAPADALGGCRGAVYGLTGMFLLGLVIVAGFFTAIAIISW